MENQIKDQDTMKLDIRRIRTLLKQRDISKDQLRKICTALMEDREYIRGQTYSVGCNEVSCGTSNDVCMAEVFEDLSDLECTPDCRVKPGTKWKHENGNLYTVFQVANLKGDHLDMTVVYKGENGVWWTKPLCDWHDRMSSLEKD